MKSSAISAAFLASIAILLPFSAFAQHSDHLHGSHAISDPPTPVEEGQSAFSAITEIVDILETDPETDWSQVDLDALRIHLVDMNELVLNAVVETAEASDEFVFVVTGPDRTREAIQRMVPAHSEFLSSELGWRTSSTLTENGATLAISVSGSEANKIRGLGFFGVMASGAHHQPHHLAIARGMRGH